MPRWAGSEREAAAPRPTHCSPPLCRRCPRPRARPATPPRGGPAPTADPRTSAARKTGQRPQLRRPRRRAATGCPRRPEAATLVGEGRELRRRPAPPLPTRAWETAPPLPSPPLSASLPGRQGWQGRLKAPTSAPAHPAGRAPRGHSRPCVRPSCDAGAGADGFGQARARKASFRDLPPAPPAPRAANRAYQRKHMTIWIRGRRRAGVAGDGCARNLLQIEHFSRST